MNRDIKEQLKSSREQLQKARGLPPTGQDWPTLYRWFHDIQAALESMASLLTTESPTTVSPSAVPERVTTIPITPPSQPLVPTGTQSGLAALDSGCAHQKTRCVYCGVSLSHVWIPVPDVSLMLSTSAKPETLSSVASQAPAASPSSDCPEP